MKNIIQLFAFILFFGSLNAQVVNNNNNQGNTNTATPTTPTSTEKKPIRKPIDGIYDKTHIYNRTPIQYVPLREADAMWSKKVWRRIDLREKINHPLHFPNKGKLSDGTSQGNWLSFWDVIYKTIDSSEINPYPVLMYDDEFCSMPLFREEFQNKLGYDGTRDSVDDDGNVIMQLKDRNFYYKTDFLAIDLKEVWFLDKQRSVLDVRIIVINPQLNIDDQTCREKNEIMARNTPGYIPEPCNKIFMPTGWLYFPEIRPFLANNDAFNNFNTSEMKSYDDIFWKRFFSSYVQREENIYNNREISNFILNGMDQVLESERITNEIRKFEHDMWEF